MQFSAIVAPTVKELFVNQIEDKILTGELEIGQRLPSERELAETMRLSKTAVHSGIADMERKGFLRVEPRRGIFVNDYARYGTLEALESIMQHSGGQLDRRNVRSVLEMREAIEGYCLRKVAAAPSPELLETLQFLLSRAHQLADQGGDCYEELAEIYFTFHHAICVASQNTLAPLIMNAFHKPAVRFWRNSARTLGLRFSVGRLERFMQLIEARDVEGACAYLKQISDTSDSIVQE
ncbi:FadR family transcriptional regulator [Anaerofilum sp. BX8]|uniref:FadR family transcriptional regulator n=1 Tax=Anaerofilum hominis TaxID=2763016 RepID=A0A923L1K7_9FIRM|nr:FCD domain-containing protein [Anaerofilum hominis]MBC5581618.1 FadR family transcriptional regulator [Anaerofilum hominis]